MGKFMLPGLTKVFSKNPAGIPESCLRFLPAGHLVSITYPEAPVILQGPGPNPGRTAQTQKGKPVPPDPGHHHQLVLRPPYYTGYCAG
jgi:hypothetical protein